MKVLKIPNKTFLRITRYIDAEAVDFSAASAASASASASTKNVDISWVVIPPTNAEAAERDNRFRFRFRIPKLNYRYFHVLDTTIARIDALARIENLLLKRDNSEEDKEELVAPELAPTNPCELSKSVHLA